jgi:Short C-terminal domain
MIRRRPLMRAAVVGGGAYMAGKHMARKSEEAAYAESDQNQRISDLEAQQQQGQYQQPPPQYQQQQQYQQPPPPPPQAAPAQGPSMIDQLNQLNELRQQGALTDEEFAAAKAKLLGS